MCSGATPNSACTCTATASRDGDGWRASRPQIAQWRQLSRLDLPSANPAMVQCRANR
jgi:hypothetical protein